MGKHIPKKQLLMVAVTAANAGMLVFSLIRPARLASAEEIVPLIRARALEIVDAQGRVRAVIRVLPPDPTVKMPDGTTGYPETVLFRMITSKGRPAVKIAAVEDGSAMSLAGDSDPTDVQILARGANPDQQGRDAGVHEAVALLGRRVILPMHFVAAPCWRRDNCR